MILEERAWTAEERHQLEDAVELWQLKLQEELKKEINDKKQQDKQKILKDT